MAPKRPRETDDSKSAARDSKKPRHGFRVGPENLPDGPWRRKVTKIKQDLIHKAKVKKAYAKIKSKESFPDPLPESSSPLPGPQLHPDRQAMLDDTEDRPSENQQRSSNPEVELKADAPPECHQEPDKDQPSSSSHSRGRRRPGYFDKQLSAAERKRAAAAEEEEEAERRRQDRDRKMAERQRYKKALAKARTPGGDGKRRLGRESGLLLEQVKRLVGKS